MIETIAFDWRRIAVKLDFAVRDPKVEVGAVRSRDLGCMASEQQGHCVAPRPIAVIG